MDSVCSEINFYLSSIRQRVFQSHYNINNILIHFSRTNGNNIFSLNISVFGFKYM